jgi:hypothetical protein
LRWNGRVASLIPLDDGLDANDTNLARMYRHPDDVNFLMPTEMRQDMLLGFLGVVCHCDRCRNIEFSVLVQISFDDSIISDICADICDVIGVGSNLTHCDNKRLRERHSTKRSPFSNKHFAIAVNALLFLPGSKNLFRTAVIAFLLGESVEGDFIDNPVVAARLRLEYYRDILRCFPTNFGGHLLLTLMRLCHDLIRAKRFMLATITLDKVEERVGKLWSEGDESALIERIIYLESCIKKKAFPPPVLEWETEALIDAAKKKNSFARRMCHMLAAAELGTVPGKLSIDFPSM